VVGAVKRLWLGRNVLERRRQLLLTRFEAYAVGGSWSPNSEIMVSRILNF
jgi:hypothetical protein